LATAPWHMIQKLIANQSAVGMTTEEILTLKRVD
jgi:hypothetical protein